MSAYDKTSIQINRCKRILALVDDYVEKQDAATRTDLRKALMEEFEAPVIAPPVAPGSVDRSKIDDLLVKLSIAAADVARGGHPDIHRAASLEIINAIDAWGAQQREAGIKQGEKWHHMSVDAYCKQRVICATIRMEERAQKAEARVKELEAKLSRFGTVAHHPV